MDYGTSFHTFFKLEVFGKSRGLQKPQLPIADQPDGMAHATIFDERGRPTKPTPTTVEQSSTANRLVTCLWTFRPSI
jgi:hypothetical protein